MLKKIAAAAALAFIASTATAANGPFYVGVDIGSTKIDHVSGSDGSFGVFGGYKFNQNIAIEGNYRRLSDFDVISPGRRDSVTIDQFGVSAIGTLPLSNNFSVFGRLGYNTIDEEYSRGAFYSGESDSGVLYGAGLGYDFSPVLSARIEWQRPASNVSNFSAGLAFKF